MDRVRDIETLNRTAVRHLEKVNSSKNKKEVKRIFHVAI